MRVLDLGCGRAASSIFLHREFGVQVWATDLWFNASENLRRIRDAGIVDGVFPIHTDARSLPFGSEPPDPASTSSQSRISLAAYWTLASKLRSWFSASPCNTWCTPSIRPALTL
jgi:Methyltransferase domain